MVDYAAMYKKLFNSQTNAIEILQKAQKETEDMYMSASEPELWVLPKDTAGEDPGKNDEE